MGFRKLANDMLKLVEGLVGTVAIILFGSFDLFCESYFSFSTNFHITYEFDFVVRIHFSQPSLQSSVLDDTHTFLPQ